MNADRATIPVGASPQEKRGGASTAVAVTVVVTRIG